jgi:lysophospholipase L1-like esterase
VLGLLAACSPAAGGSSLPSTPSTVAGSASPAVGVAAPAGSKPSAPAASKPTATPTPIPVPASGLRIVALGDSVTSGYNCNCAAFPDQYAALLATRDSIRTQAANLGVPSLTSAGLLAQLADGSAANAGARAAVASADIVVVTIGANDFSDEHDPITAGACGGVNHTACTRDELATMSRTLSAVVGQIRILRDGAPTTIMLTGYWNVFEDGEVATNAFPEQGIAASVALTKEANAAIRTDALAENAIYVDLWPVFEGSNSNNNPTDLLASDGDHPHAAGHAAIAAQLLADTPRF